MPLPLLPLALVGGGLLAGGAGGLLGGRSAAKDARRQQKDAKKLLKFLRGEYKSNKKAGLEALGDTKNRGMMELLNLTDQENRDVQQDFKEQEASTQAQVVNRGLGSSTIGTVMRQGVARERGNALRRLMDQQALRRINFDQDTTGALTSFLSSLNPGGVTPGFDAVRNAPSAPSMSSILGNQLSALGGGATTLGGGILGNFLGGTPPMSGR